MKQALVFVMMATVALVAFDDEPLLNQDETFAASAVYPDQRGLNNDEAEVLA